MKHARKYNCGSFFIFILPSPIILWKVIILLSMIMKWKVIFLLSTWKGLKVFKYAIILPHLNYKKIVDVLFSFIMPAFHNWFHWRLLNSFHDFLWEDIKYQLDSTQSLPLSICNFIIKFLPLIIIVIFQLVHKASTLTN